MSKAYLVRSEKTLGDTAVDGLLAGLPAGLAMALVLALAGLVSGTPPLTTLGYFDPAQAGGWIAGLLAHLAVSAVYGALFGLLRRLAGRVRPSLHQWPVLWGALYGLLLWVVAHWVLLAAVPSPLAQIAAGQFALGHLAYGLVLGLRTGD